MLNSIYTYSNATDFDGNLSHSNKENFRARINSPATAIAPTCTEIRINVDIVELWFDAALSHDEETVLAALVATKYHDSYIFDAIVDTRGNGDYTRVADAFAAGKTSVYVRDGLYIETANIVLPDGGQLVGESQSNVKLVLAAGNSVIVDGSGGIKVNSGTISIAHGSSTVIGAGTNFTALLSQSFILLGTNFYQVLSIESDTSLTLKEVYQGKSLSGMACLAERMFTGVKISNIVIVNSSSTGLYLRAIRHCSFKGIAVLNCTPNITVADAGDSSLYEFICGFSNGVGVTLDNAHSMLCDTLDVYNSTSHGIELKSHSSSNVFDSCSTSNNAGIGVYISGNAFDINVADTVIKHNNNSGLVTDSGSNQIIVVGCTVIENLLVGIGLGGLFGVVSNNIVSRNGGHGISGAHNCVLTGNQLCENGGDGIFYHSGTSTIVTSNRLCANIGSGINIEATSCVLANNIVCESGTSGVVYSGTNGSVTGNVVYGNSLHGVHCTATASQTIIAQNQVNSNAGNGLVFDVGATNNLVNFNMLSGNALGNTVDNGTTNEFVGNKLF